MKEIIAHIISLRNGVKEVELSLIVMGKVTLSRFSNEAFDKALHELVISGEVKAFGYYDSNSPTLKVRFMYFSGVTSFLSLKGYNGNAYSGEALMVRKSQRNA